MDPLSPSFDGVLVVDKPSGRTSFDVVRDVRTLLKIKKVGHTGTLDPMATGVLPICLGEATKIAGHLTESDKAYDAVIKLGAETDTLDAEGKVVAEYPVPVLTPELIESALAKFRGSFLQTPPMYSAVKIGGKRLYELARKGEEIEREARPVTVHSLELRDFNATELTVSVSSSKGFFVRTLAQELGRAMGTGAHLKALRRTKSGPFTLAMAVPLDRLKSAADVVPSLVPMVDALSELPRITLDAADVQRVRHGVPLEVRAEPGKVCLLSESGELLALAEAGEAGKRLVYLRVFAAGVAPPKA